MAEPPPIPDPLSEAPKPPGMSLAARLLNVFAMPGTVFAEVKLTRRSVANWLVPLVVAALVGVLWAVVIYSQPATQQNMRKQQEKVLEKQLQTHKLSQADVDLLRRWFVKLTSPASLMVLGSLGAVFSAAVRVFWWAFVLWLLGRTFLKARFGYPKALELAGLGTLISVLGMLVTLLLMVKFHRGVAAFGFTLATTDLEALWKDPLVLGAASVFSFWSVAVMAVALARLSGAPFLRAAWLVFAYWVLQESFCGLFGLAQLGF
jgi:hypothetical protein